MIFIPLEIKIIIKIILKIIIKIILKIILKITVICMMKIRLFQDYMRLIIYPLGKVIIIVKEMLISH